MAQVLLPLGLLLLVELEPHSDGPLTDFPHLPGFVGAHPGGSAGQVRLDPGLHLFRHPLSHAGRAQLGPTARADGTLAPKPLPGDLAHLGTDAPQQPPHDGLHPGGLLGPHSGGGLIQIPTSL